MTTITTTTIIRTTTPATAASDADDLTQWRCPHCGRRLGDLKLAPGSIVEIKCSSCNTIVRKIV